MVNQNKPLEGSRKYKNANNMLMAVKNTDATLVSAVADQKICKGNKEKIEAEIKLKYFLSVKA